MPLRKIIVGVDRDAHTRDAVRLAALLARPERAELVLAHTYRNDRDKALRLLEEIERTLPYGTRASLRALESRSPEHGLHELADEESADLIVVGGRGQSTFVTGAHCGIALAPVGFADDPDPGLRVIGVAFDGSTEAHEAVAAAADIALSSAATLRLIGVAEPPPRPAVGLSSLYVPEMVGDYRAALLSALEAAADDLPLSLRTQVVLVSGEPADQLIERATPLSLLVTGSRAYGPLRRALLGSVSAKLLSAAPCPILVVPRGAREAQRAAA